MTAAAVCAGIDKWFDAGDNRIHVLRGLDLEIPMGSMAMLVGPSGCGKTTLISIVAGLLDATGGELTVLGQRPAVMSTTQRIVFRQKNLGFVFQQFNLLPALTAAENAAVPLFVAGWKRHEAVEKASDLLVTLGLGDRLHARPSLLSGGEQQRVAFARALIHEPRLVVCDEPTSALDAKTGHNVMELLSRIAVRPDRAVIVVTHDSRIFQFADLVAHMEDGRIIDVERMNARSVIQ
ncbi:MAG TPA: ABC transporter ATP-binding protein [Vicinamibacterales bacterium]|nr:ABC transporter ATP-binding protein [Vicinamibacterales bacterium]